MQTLQQEQEIPMR